MSLDPTKFTVIKRPRGFAAIDPKRQKAIASKGGKAAHASGRAHEFTSAEAIEAGRKGGLAVSKNIEHMREIGRKGGAARARIRPDEIAENAIDREISRR